MNFGLMNSKFEYIISYLKENDSIGLPIICFSISGNSIFITTKKIASRYFEFFNESTRFIEFYVKNNTLEKNLNTENRLKFFDYDFHFFENNKDLSVDDFFNKLGINNITDIFSNRFLDNWEVNLITRDPIIRLLSGFTEIVDSLIGNQINLENEEILKRYISYDKLNNFSGIRNLPEESLSPILNDYSKKIYNQIVFDEHTSLWNTFLFYLISKSHSTPNIIDIDNDIHMKKYPNFNLDISNKSMYLKWLGGNNRTQILNFIKKIEYPIINEYSNYLRIKALKY